MEYCPGGELFEKLTNNREEFTEQKAAVIMQSLFLAINHCHSNGIAHCDLKPENIMYDGADRIKIIDFNLSYRTAQAAVPNLISGEVIGSPYY